MPDVRVTRTTVEVEADFGGDDYRVDCLGITRLKEGDAGGLGTYRYFLNGRAITAEEADVRYYESDRGKIFRRVRLQARAAYIVEFS